MAHDLWLDGWGVCSEVLAEENHGYHWVNINHNFFKTFKLKTLTVEGASRVLLLGEGGAHRRRITFALFSFDS